MKHLIVALVLFNLAFVLAMPIRESNESYVMHQFRSWTKKFSKTHSDEEIAQRFTNFKASLDRIAKKNAEHPKNQIWGLTKFSDMTPEEFRQKVLMTPRQPKIVPGVDVLKPKAQAPNTLDWRTKGAVTPVKNQEQCGSCWAFSVTENVESQWILAGKGTNTTVDLAPQQIVDCDNGDDGCGGGDPPNAYEYLMNAGGLESESAYPYTAEDGSCKFSKNKVSASISSWKYATSGDDEKTLQSNLASWGPLSVCVDAANWQDYTGGVMGGWQCAWINILDHCVELVGYDTTASTPYWIVRNSWGTDWGQNGYILLEMFDNTCGIAEEATTSVI